MNWYNILKISQITQNIVVQPQTESPQKKQDEKLISKQKKPFLGKRDLKGKFAPKDFTSPQITQHYEQSSLPEIQKSEDDIPVIKKSQVDMADDDQDNINQPLPITPIQQEKRYPTSGGPRRITAMQAMQWAQNPQSTKGFQNSSGQTVWIDYICLSGKRIQRNIQPHGIFRAKTTGNTIVVSFDATVNAIKGFIISNIKDFKFIGRNYNKKFYFSSR